DQDGFGDDANASTLRLRLNYGTAQWRAWSGFAEFDHVVELVRDYNSGAGTSTAVRGRYPVVADPGGPDLNQLYVQFAAAEHWRLRLGRQRILLDDQRFVGGVGWRQNEQTYDGLSLHYTGLPGTTVQYTYVANVERIFGSDVPAGDHEQSTHLLNVRRAVNDDLAVVAYAYLIDNDDAPAFSTNTFGIRAEGGVALGSARLNLLGEYARQSDAANAPADYDADYYRLRALWKSGAITAGIGYEVLGSDNAQGFRTPLATLHAFNGWADKFLATPAGGLEDRYLQLGYELGPWSLQALFHDFEAESSGASYGTELDVSAKRALSKRADLLLKLAAFDSDEPSAFDDTTKAWLMLTTRF
ncbi:MAG: alginate export family protein, partial [Pseudomonadota bacterium]